MTNYHHPRGIHTLDADLLFQKKKEEGYKLSHRSNKRKNIDKYSSEPYKNPLSSVNNTLTDRGTN